MRPFNARTIEWLHVEQKYACDLGIISSTTNKRKIFHYTREKLEEYLLPVDYSFDVE
jgi:hypothetical protein